MFFFCVCDISHYISEAQKKNNSEDDHLCDGHFGWCYQMIFLLNNINKTK